MLNILIIYDDLDSNRGDYFSASKQDLTSKILPINISKLQALNTNDCLDQTIDHYTTNFDGQPFIFIAYTHGNENSLFISDERYIHSNNTYLFNSSLFYACSCLSAKLLGQNLIDNGCIAFVGYDGVLSSCNPEAEAIYQLCENTFILNFLNYDLSIQECLKLMYDKYIEMGRYIAMNFGFFEASNLANNLAAFQLICSDAVKDYTRNNFVG